MKCKICGKKNSICFSGKILDKYNVSFYHCSMCHFVQTEEPHWLDEAYVRPINISDTGYMARNQFYAEKLTVLLFFLFGKNGRFLDYAGGYGVFVRLMRDIGFDFSWYDKYTENIIACGFEWDKKNENFDAVTLFEVFEHFVEPFEEVINLLKVSDTIVFSTELLPDPLPGPKDWWYYGLDHGQHISFYSIKTFNYIADKFGLNYYNSGSLHFLTKKNISNWVLLTSKFSKYGLYKIVTKMLYSKTWSDHELMEKVDAKLK